MDAFQEEVKGVEEAVVEAPVLQFVEVDELAQLHLLEQSGILEEKAVQEEAPQVVQLGGEHREQFEEELVQEEQYFAC